MVFQGYIVMCAATIFYANFCTKQGEGGNWEGKKEKQGSSDDIFSVCKFHEKNIAKKMFSQKKYSGFFKKKNCEKKSNYSRNSEKLEGKKNSVRKKIAKIFIEKDSDIFTEK